MKKRRVFIAINLNAHSRALLEETITNTRRKAPEVEGIMRFIPSSGWHITLSFLGYQDEDAVVKIVGALSSGVKECRPTDIVFEKITYGPPGHSPRMVWLVTQERTSQSLGTIKETLEKHLDDAGVTFQHEQRPFEGHITLARAKSAVTTRSHLPVLDEHLRASFRPQSIELMESELKRNGAEYSVLQRFPLKEEGRIRPLS